MISSHVVNINKQANSFISARSDGTVLILPHFDVTFDMEIFLSCVNI